MDDPSLYTAQIAADPTLPPEVQVQIATTRPDLIPWLESNPNLYSGLRDWIASAKTAQPQMNGQPPMPVPQVPVPQNPVPQISVPQMPVPPMGQPQGPVPPMPAPQMPAPQMSAPPMGQPQMSAAPMQPQPQMSPGGPQDYQTHPYAAQNTAQYAMPGAYGGYMPVMAPKKKSRKLLFGVLGALTFVLVFLGVGGVFLLQSALATGAKSPVAAMEQLEKGIQEKDLLSVAKLIPPSEYSTVLDVIEKNSALAGGGIGERADASVFTELGKALDVQRSDFDYTVIEETADLSIIEIDRWDLEVSFDPQPLVDFVQKEYEAMTGESVNADDIGLDDLKADSFNGDVLEDAESLRLVAIQEDGKWYISPYMSFMEAASSEVLKDERLKPDYEAASDLGVGGSSPSAAVETSMDSLVTWFSGGSGSSEALSDFIDVLAAPERRAAKVYLEPLLDEVGADLEDLSGGGFDIDLELSEIELGSGITVVGFGDTKINLEEDYIQFRNGTVILGVEGQSVSFDYARLMPDPSHFGLVAIQEEGSWRVSLFGSVANLALLPVDQAKVDEYLGNQARQILAESGISIGKDGYSASLGTVLIILDVLTQLDTESV